VRDVEREQQEQLATARAQFSMRMAHDHSSPESSPALR